MKWFVIVLMVFVGLVLALVLGLARFGLFAKVRVEEAQAGPYVFVYQKHIGAYKNVGPVMEGVVQSLKNDFGIETTKGFGMYFDNPREVAQEKLRSVVGCIVEGKSSEDLLEVRKKFSVREFPVSQSVVVDFPFSGKMSILLGVFKVYPVLGKYVEEHQLKKTPIVEIYDAPSKTIRYIAPTQIDGKILEDYLN